MPRAGRSERGTEIGQIERGRGIRESGKGKERETDRERVRGTRAWQRVVPNRASGGCETPARKRPYARALLYVTAC